jgi:hypothetical protein
MFEYIHIISTKKSKDRRDTIRKNITSKSNILVPIFFPAITALDYPNKQNKKIPGWIFCAKSHIGLIKLAKHLNLPYIIVSEDDTDILDNFDEYFAPILNYLKSSDQWDIFNGNPGNLYSKNTFRLLNKNPDIIKYSTASAANFIIYNKTTYDYLINLENDYDKLIESDEISTDSINNQAIDMIINNVIFRCVTSIPYLTKQTPCFSILENKLVDHSTCFFEWGESIIKNMNLNHVNWFLSDKCFILNNFKYSAINQKSDNLKWINIHDNFKGDISNIKNEVIFFTDQTIDQVDFLDNSNIKVAWLLEPITIDIRHVRYTEQNHTKFDYIFTHDKVFLDRHKSDPRFIYYPFGGCWIKDEDKMIYDKKKLLSIIASRKNDLTGHKLRHNVIRTFRSRLDVFGYGYKPLDDKLDGLKDYYFQIVIENSILDDYFTEKIIDCFATGVIPVYWGTKNIKNYFDSDGIIMFENISDLQKIITQLTPKLYTSKLDAVKKNFDLVNKYKLPEDWIFNNYRHLFFKNNRLDKNINVINYDTKYETIWNLFKLKLYHQIISLSYMYLSDNINTNNKMTQQIKFFQGLSYQKLNYNKKARLIYEQILQTSNLDDQIRGEVYKNYSIIFKSKSKNINDLDMYESYNMLWDAWINNKYDIVYDLAVEYKKLYPDMKKECSYATLMVSLCDYINKKTDTDNINVDKDKENINFYPGVYNNLDKIYDMIWKCYAARRFSMLYILCEKYLSSVQINNIESQHVKFFQASSLYYSGAIQKAVEILKEILLLDNLNDRVKTWSMNILNNCN